MMHANETIFSSHFEDKSTKSSPTPQFTHVHGLSLASPSSSRFPASASISISLQLQCEKPSFSLAPSWDPGIDESLGPFTVSADPFPSHRLASLTSLLLFLETGALLLQSQDQEVVMIPVQLGHGPWGNCPVLKSHVGGFVDRYRHQPTAQISMLQVLLFSVRRRRQATRGFSQTFTMSDSQAVIVASRQSCSVVWERRLTLRVLLHLGWGYSIYCNLYSKIIPLPILFPMNALPWSVLATYLRVFG